MTRLFLEIKNVTLLNQAFSKSLKMWSDVNWNQRYMWGSDSNKIS